MTSEYTPCNLIWIILLYYRNIAGIFDKISKYTALIEGDLDQTDRAIY